MSFELFTDAFLASLIVATAVATIRVRSLFASAMLLSIYSLLMAALWVDLHAPDVAFTEAAVGAGVSTIFLLTALMRIGRKERGAPRVHWPALLTCAAAGALIAGAAGDLPALGEPDAPLHHHVGQRYLEEAVEATHVPNVVTAVLAGYRGYDTMFEVTVIFTAGASVLLILHVPRRRDRSEGRTP